MARFVWLAAVGLLSCGPATQETSSAPSPQPVSAVNIAHRGASAYAPEHTLPAYQLALEMGADYVEQDLQLTRDGVLVCLHDTTLERTTNVEDVFPNRAHNAGDGDGRRVWRVSDFTLDEVKQLDAGSWFGSEFTGVAIPTFQEAIDLVKGRAGLYPETKAPEEYEDLGFSMEAELVRVLTANGLDSRAAQETTPVFVQSSSRESLQRMRRLAGTTFPLIQLVGRPQSGMLTEEGLVEVATYADGVGVAFPILLAEPTKAKAIRAAGFELHPYTVRASRIPTQFSDATAFMSYLIDDLGVTGIFTDNPDLFPDRM